MGICNAKYEFIYVNIGAEGRAADGGIWRESTFYEALQKDDNPLDIPEPQEIEGMNMTIPYFLVADDAFKLSPNVLKPFPGASETLKERVYNYRIGRCRRVIENTFGILTSRFRIFHRTITVQPDYATDIVVACCILHNYMRRETQNQDINDASVDQNLPDGSYVGGDWRQNRADLDPLQSDQQRNPSVYAKRVRLALADYFLTP